MKENYWKKIKIQCPTKTLRNYNGGDMTDTVTDLCYYFDRAFSTNAIGIKDKFQIQFRTDQDVFPLAEDRPEEKLEMIIEVTSPTFHKEALERELESVEMREGFEFYEEKYGVFELIK